MSFTITHQNPPYILHASDASEPIAFAASELSRYLGKVLSANVAVGADASAAEQVIELTESQDAELTDEGYELALQRPGLFTITGGGPLGVLYGAYEFLRRHIGCSFAGLGEQAEHVPRESKIRITQPEPLRRTPRLWYRGMQFAVNHNDQQLIDRIDWMAKNGLNYAMVKLTWDTSDAEDSQPVIDPETGLPIDLASKPGSISPDMYHNLVRPQLLKRGLKIDINHHNLFFWLPPSKYFNEHPEWYAMRDGKRIARRQQMSICSSNADAMAELTRNVLAFLREHPETSIIGVVPEDGYGACECEQCRKLDKPGEDIGPRTNYRSPEGESRAKIRRYALMVNQVAEAVKEQFPGTLVGMGAYVDLAWPPRDVKLLDNVVPWVAIYWRCAAHPLTPDACDTNRFFHDLLQQWKRTHDGKIITYSYYMGMDCQLALPYPMGRVLMEDWHELERLGIDGATIQSRDGHFHAYGWNYLCFAKRAWDRQADSSAAMDEFLQGMFGAAGAALRPIWEAVDQAADRVRQLGPQKAGYITRRVGSDTSPTADVYLRPEGSNIIYFMRELRPILPDCLTQARAACRTDREDQQLDIFEHVVAYWEKCDHFFRKLITCLLLEDHNLHDEATFLHGAIAEVAEDIHNHLITHIQGTGWTVQKDIDRFRRYADEFTTKAEQAEAQPIS